MSNLSLIKCGVIYYILEYRIASILVESERDLKIDVENTGAQ